MQERVCIAVVTGAHGVRGAVRLKTFTARPEDVAAYGPVSDESGGRTFRLTVTGRRTGGVIARLDGIEDREAAEALKGLRLHVPRSALPEPGEDEFYHADLLGLAVETTDGRRLGRVRAVFDFGAGDVIEVAGDEGAPLVLPFTRRVVPVVDLAGGRLVVELPDGIEAPPASGDPARPAARRAGSTRRRGGAGGGAARRRRHAGAA